MNYSKIYIASILVAITSCLSLTAQDDKTQEDVVFTIVEQQPEFPGGMDALGQWLGENINYPQAAKDAGAQGTVYVSFVVKKDGSISDAKVLRGVGKYCDREALRVVADMPKWKAGMQRGKAVNVQYNLPIRFSLSDNNDPNNK